MSIGTGRDSREVANVCVMPNEFSKYPIVSGWCDPRQLIRALYIGLLGICVRETDWFERSGEGGKWEDFRLATYNKLQSNIIERFITAGKDDDFNSEPRQRFVRSVEEMLADFKELQVKLKD
ncbi:MAG: hypothetical protein II951_12300 [Bacteroidales bacterium]|nr:hypothetical protein [Bacteroidales bacterium]